MLNVKEAKKALKEGKQVQNGTNTFMAYGINNDIIMNQDGFVFTQYFNTIGRKATFQLNKKPII